CTCSGLAQRLTPFFNHKTYLESDLDLWIGLFRVATKQDELKRSLKHPAPSHPWNQQYPFT
ncbi:MAG TPA: hypothetical protein V6C46_02570, partial [Coleofasciculaceae cyanobacterium]